MLMSGAVGIGMFPQFEVVHGYEGLVPLSNTLQVTRYVCARLAYM